MSRHIQVNYLQYKNPKITVKTGPEAKGAKRLRLHMRAKGWYIKKLHGGRYQSGLPDLLCLHSLHGHRWVETKSPGGKLRQSQIHEFTIMEQHGEQIYVLEDEKDYMKLFNKKGNWLQYVRM